MPKTKLFNFENIQFKINWASGITLFSAIAFCIYFYVENQGLKDTVKTLGMNNDKLLSEVASIRGEMQGFNNAVKLFLENPPNLTNYKLEELKKKVDYYHRESPTPLNLDTASFINRIPGSIN